MQETLHQSWTSFRAGVIPKNAPPDQIHEMRRAFYAGAWAMLCNFVAIGDDSVSEAEGVATMESLKAECEMFNRLLQEGRA